MERSADIDAWVVGCDRLILSEVWRLVRLGVRLDVDDARQEGFLAVLGLMPTMDPAYSRAQWASRARRQVRGHLLNEFLRKPTQQKRHAPTVNIDALHAEPAIGSHEVDTIERATLAQLAARFPRPSSSGTRQARHQMERRWLSKVSAYVAGVPA